VKGRRIRIRRRRITRRKRKSRKKKYMRMVTMMSGQKEDQTKKKGTRRPQSRCKCMWKTY
jgi:hypothetical protein